MHWHFENEQWGEFCASSSSALLKFDDAGCMEILPLIIICSSFEMQ